MVTHYLDYEIHITPRWDIIATKMMIGKDDKKDKIKFKNMSKHKSKVIRSMSSRVIPGSSQGSSPGWMISSISRSIRSSLGVTG